MQKYIIICALLSALAWIAPLTVGAGESNVDQALQDELERIGDARKAPDYKEYKTVPAHVNVVPLEVPKEFERSTEVFPKSSHDVTIGADGNFLRDGKPVFLFGVEAEMYNGAWLHRILGIDFTELTVLASSEFRNALKVEKKTAADGKVLLEASAPLSSPWLELRIKEALRGGTLITFEYAIGKEFWPLSYKEYKFEPPLYCPGIPGFRKTSSHMLDACQEGAEGKQLYLDMMNWSARQSRKYPIWLYELVNEVSYICPCLENAREFQDQMQKKFGSIEKANKTWSTHFADFKNVIPPLNIDSSSIYNSKWGTIPFGKALSVPLWIDWARFMEQRGGTVFKNLESEMRKTDPNAKCTIQSPYWQGRNAMSSATKALAEDAFGSEHGLQLFRQTAGQERWDEMRQMFEQQFANDLVATCVPAKPGVNLECGVIGYPHSKDDPSKNFIIGSAGLRTFYWQQVVHGVGGSVISYFYDNEVSEGGGSVWDPTRMNLDSIREMPRVHNEIASVAEIVLPRPRIAGRIGVLYSLETARIIRPEAKDCWQKLTPEVLDYYAAATLTRVPVDVITSREILDGKIGKYALIVLPHAFRVAPGVLEALSAFVKAGGCVLASPDSLRYEDDFGQRLDASEFIGGKSGAPIVKEATLTFEGEAKEISGGTTTGLKSAPSGEQEFDFAAPVHGYEFEATTAKILGRCDQQAAFSVQSLGKGFVYFLAREPNPETRRGCLDWIVKRSGLAPDVNVAFADALGAKCDFVETHLFSRDGRAVVYALNWGGGVRQANLLLREPPAGKSTLRNLHTGRYLAASGEESDTPVEWTTEQLLRGIPAQLPSQDPVVLLLEKSGADPLPLKALTGEQKEVLSWLYRASPKSDSRVLIDGSYVLEGRVHKWRMPTAVKMLEDHGFQVDSLSQPLRKAQMRNGDELKRDKLENYQVFVLAGTHGRNNWEDDDLKIALDYVKNGGGLLYCPPTDHSSGTESKLLQRLGIDTPFANFYDPNAHILDEPLYVTFTNPSAHPTTEGVKVFQSAGAIPIRIDGVKEKVTVLFKGGPASYTAHPWGDSNKAPGQAVAVAFDYGKGRVIVVGGDAWLRPDDLALGDNKVFLLNAIEWLAHKR